MAMYTRIIMCLG